MERCTTRAEFCQALQARTETLATEIWTTLVEGSGADADAWLRRSGGEWYLQIGAQPARELAQDDGIAAALRVG